MAKQVKIKDIARMAGVSAGTVDRILHNRGNVSRTSREAVERVLSETGYRYNIHTSAVSLRKEYRIVIAIPTAIKGEYWDSIRTGIEHAIDEYSDISIVREYAYYNQFDIYSCRASFKSITESSPNAVIIGPTFASETRELCSELDRMKIPYAFVDSVIDGLNPTLSFSCDQRTCGLTVARLLHLMTPGGQDFAILSSRRTGNERSNNSLARKAGFMEYFGGNCPEKKIREVKFSVLDPQESERDVLKFIEENPDVRGIAVLNSRGFIVADILEKRGIGNVSLVCFDLTDNNRRCISKGTISAVICQRPELQGFYAVSGLIRNLLYNQEDGQKEHLMPIDIIIAENLPYYKEYLP